MPPPTTPLPPPNTIVTDILSHLSNAPACLPSTPSKHSGDNGPSTRPYLLTLHALFPTILLPALDLLDRRLVTRLELSDPLLPKSTVTTDDNVNGQQPTYAESNGRTGPTYGEPQGDKALQSPQPAATNAAQAIIQPTGPASLRRERPQANLEPTKRTYYVRSSQPPSTSSSTRFSSRSDRSSARAPQGGQNQVGFESKSYEVRTRAWSCSCAAFAFAALSTHHHPRHHHQHGGHRYYGTTSEENEGEEHGVGAGHGYENNDVQGYDENGDQGAGRAGYQEEPDIGVNGGIRFEWGGLMALYSRASPRSTRGHERAEYHPRAPVPLCKHLLACVLSEWWDEAAELVERRVVGRGEFAGWAAGWGG